MPRHSRDTRMLRWIKVHDSDPDDIDDDEDTDDVPRARGIRHADRARSFGDETEIARPASASFDEADA